jgi:hypothetical protein
VIPFAKLASGPSAVELLDRARAIESRRTDGGPFTLSITVANETRLLIVNDASGRAIGASDILSAENVRSAARRLIRKR